MSWLHMPDVVIAAVLKPAADTRNFHKLGKSIALLSGHSVVCLGSGTRAVQDGGVVALPICSAQRLAWQRVWAWYRVFKYCLRTRPKVLIITTAELIPVAWMLKRLRPELKLVYDVQENYTANVQHGSHYSSWLKPILPRVIKIAEDWLAQNADQWWWAEQCYETELQYKPASAYLLKNLSLEGTDRPPVPLKLSQLSELNLLVYGTLGQDYGTLEAIQWFEGFQKIMEQYYPDTKVSLTIAGYAADEQYAKRVLEALKSSSEQGLELKWHGINEMVPHALLIDLLRSSHVVLLPYQVNDALRNRMPTKLYDAIALQKVVWMSPNPVWQTVYETMGAGCAVNFTEEPNQESVRKLLQFEYYAKALETERNEQEVRWHVQLPTLKSALQNLGFSTTSSEASVNAG